MKKILFAIFLTTVLINKSIAVSCDGVEPTCVAENCKMPTGICLDRGGTPMLILTCTGVGCYPGFEAFTDSCNGSPFISCKKVCSSANCISDSSFSSYSTGYESKATRACSNNECVVTSRVYRCASGYYGSSSNGTTGCNRCPTDSKTGQYGSSSAGTTSITGCYQNSGRTGSDSTGTLTYTANCSYTN